MNTLPLEPLIHRLIRGPQSLIAKIDGRFALLGHLHQQLQFRQALADSALCELQGLLLLLYKTDQSLWIARLEILGLLFYDKRYQPFLDQTLQDRMTIDFAMPDLLTILPEVDNPDLNMAR